MPNWIGDDGYNYFGDDGSIPEEELSARRDRWQKSTCPAPFSSGKPYHGKMNLKDFQDRLALAHYGEAYVAGRISAEGFDVLLPGLHVAQTEAEALDPKWKNTVDLVVAIGDGPMGDSVFVEVKSQSERFTDDPASRRSRLVCSAGSFKRDAHYIFLSKPTACLLWLPKNSEVERKEHTDTLRGETYKVMTHMPGALRSFADFVAHLKGM